MNTMRSNECQERSRRWEMDTPPDASRPGAAPWELVGESIWEMPDASDADEDGVVAIGADLEAATLVAAYSNGLFPMRVQGRAGPLGWWSPDPRGIMPINGFHASRSLRAARPKFSISLNQDFEAVIRGCGAADRPHGWIDESFFDAYCELHSLGVAHAVEVRNESGDLVGGLYGVRIAGMFAGESMFHAVTNASKIALWATCELLALDGVTLFDVQWLTDHLASLGAIAIPRTEYLQRLAAAISSG